MLRLWSEMRSGFRRCNPREVSRSRQSSVLTFGLLHLSAQPFAIVMHKGSCTVVHRVGLTGATDSAVASPNRGALRGLGSFRSGRR